MKKSSIRGFTLIELLVVITIIGLLSTVIAASLGSARNKGADAAVKSDLGSIRSQAEVYYNTNNNSYGTITNCSTGVFSDTTIASGVAHATTNGGTPTCAGNAQAWAIVIPLKGGGTWCADSSGYAGVKTQVTGGVCGP